MRFLIFMARESPDAALMLIETIRYYHEDAFIVHLTDLTTPALYDANAALRLPWVKGEPMTLRMNHLKSLEYEPAIMLDTDILVTGDLSSMLRGDFDVGLTLRIPPGEKVMPYNTGVMVTRNPAFFSAVRDRMEREPKYKVWPREQEAIARETETGKWQVKELSGVMWNYPPPIEKVSPSAKILHYKGDRKRYMLRHFESGIWRSVQS